MGILACATRALTPRSALPYRSDGDTRIATFVAGVGPQVDDLNRIAAAGQTGTAVMLDATVSPGQALIDHIRSLSGCGR